MSVNTKPVDGRFHADTRTVGSLKDWTPPQSVNVWFSPNPLKRELPEGRKGRREDVACGQTLYADLDVKEGALASIDECAAVIDKLAAALGVEPSVVIRSGHGLQPIWRIDEPKPIEDDGAAWITISERWGELVRATVASVNPDAKADSTFNIDRILRCPGSFNLKFPDDPVPASCVLNRGAEAVSVAALDALLPDLDVTVAPITGRATTSEGLALLDGFRDGAMSAPVVDRVNAVLTALEEGTLRHPSMNDAVLALARLGAKGQRGVPAALGLIRQAFSEVADARGDADEFDRSLRGALRIVAADGPPMDTYTGTAFQPGGIWHRDTGWVPHPDEPGLMKRGVMDSAGEEPKAATVSSWTPADVATALDGAGPPKPTVLRRSDGTHLFYAGKVHSVHGESESGKSWVVQCAAAQELLGEGRVLYVDFEDDVSGVAGRLVRLGVPRDVVADRDRFVYVHPEESLNSDVARDAFAALMSQPFTLAVVDGVTDAMGVFGYSLNDNDDIAKWQRELPRRIASLSGAAVVCVDHVTKDADSRGRFAIGGQHKIAGLDGAAFTVEVDRPFGVGMAGVASVRVGKDRPGHVRGLGVGWRKQDRTQKVATFHLDGTGPVLAWNLTPPDDDSDSKLPAGAATRNSGGGAFRPTWFMEQISRYWEEADDPAARTQNKTVTAMCEARKAAGKPPHRQHWRTAIEFLVNERYASTVVGPRNAEVHSVLRPYRQNEDPASDAYTGGRTFQMVTDGDGRTRIEPKLWAELNPETAVEQ